MKKVLSLGFVLFVSLFIVLTYARSQSNAIIELNADYTWNWVNGSPTPLVYTATPGPTQTPWIITATPDSFLTPDPTQEIPPTETPDPLCLLQNQANALIRVRNLPSTSGTTTLGWIENGAYIHPVAYYVGTDYIWYKIFWDENTLGWTANFYTYISGDCEGLLYENPF